MNNSLSSTYIIKLNNFEGPFDLLLHLIEKNKIDIGNIPISDITDQYMEYLFAMQELDLSLASEFLFMAATLLQMKSKMLLPNEKAEALQDTGKDPLEELERKLSKYKKYKDASQYLKNMEENWANAYYKPHDFYMNSFNSNINNEHLMVSLDELNKAYVQLSEKNKNKLNLRANEIEIIKQKEKVSIRNKIKQIKRVLSKQSKFIFNKVFFKEGQSITEVITSFLALLILVKVGKASIDQEEPFSDIVVKHSRENKDGDPGNGM